MFTFDFIRKTNFSAIMLHVRPRRKVDFCELLRGLHGMDDFSDSHSTATKHWWINNGLISKYFITYESKTFRDFHFVDCRN